MMTPSALDRRWVKRGGRPIDAAIVLLLVIAGLKLTFGLERIVDIGLYDESGYLYGGVSLVQKGLLPASWAPLYAVWYHMLSWFEADRVSLYYLNYKIMTIAPAVLIYLVMRAYKLGFGVSVGVAWLFLISLANLYVWPKPAHFALTIILLFLLIQRLVQRSQWSLPLLAIGALLGAFARPEYMLSYLLLVVGYIFFVAKQRTSLPIREQLIPALTLIAASVGLIAIFGVPGLDNQGSRSFEAFGQHFAINWVGWSGSGLNPWTDYKQIMAMNFGAANSISAAFTHNPSLVLRHIGSNIVNYLLTVIQMPFVHFNVILPGASRAASLAEGGFLMLGLAGWAFAVRKALFANLGSKAGQHTLLLYSFGCFALPAAVSAIVIYPEQHYLIAQLTLAAIVGSVILSSDRPRAAELPARGLLAIVALLVIATPFISTNWYFSEQGRAEDRQLNNLHTIEYLRSLNITQDMNMLEADGGYYIYVGDQVHRVPQYTKDTDFTTFMRRTKLDLIVVSSELAGDSRFKDDPTWVAFLSNSRAFGFEAVDIPGTDRRLIARSAMFGSVMR